MPRRAVNLLDLASQAKGAHVHVAVCTINDHQVKIAINEGRYP